MCLPMESLNIPPDKSSSAASIFSFAVSSLCSERLTCVSLCTNLHPFSCNISVVRQIILHFFKFIIGNYHRRNNNIIFVSDLERIIPHFSKYLLCLFSRFINNCDNIKIGFIIIIFSCVGTI